MIQTLQISSSNSLLDSNSQIERNWIYYLFMGKLAEYNRLKKLKRVDYWWIEIEDINNSVTRKIPFDVFKHPIRGLSDAKLNLDSIKPIKNIDSELFNDMWSIYDKRDFNELVQIHSKYLNNWKSIDKFDPPVFPSIIIDLKCPKDIIELETIEELVNQVDYVGYEWSESERLIDSKGNIYSEIKYRPALKSDLKFLLDLRIQTMNPYLVASSLPTSELAHRQRIDYKFEHASIIEVNNIAIGLLKIDRQEDKIDLIQIQIAPPYQGKEIGRKILNDLISEAIVTGKMVTLNVLKTNTAKDLYANIGFRIVSETDSSYFMLFEKRVSKQ